jgi:hypothetical protein
LATGFAKGVGFAMYGWIIILDSSIASTTKQLTISIKQRRANGHTTFLKADLCFGECDGKHVCVVNHELSCVNYLERKNRHRYMILHKCADR